MTVTHSVPLVLLLCLRRWSCQAVDVDCSARLVTCRGYNGHEFTVPYDHLVLAVGAKNNTFGVDGADEYTYFLKSTSLNTTHQHRRCTTQTRSTRPEQQIAPHSLTHSLVHSRRFASAVTCADSVCCLQGDHIRHSPLTR